MPLAYPDSPYGVSILMDFFSGTPQYQIPMSIVNQCKALPVAWARLIFSWGRIEGPIGTYKAASLSALDTNVQQFNSVGINVAFCCTSPPTFRKTQSWGGGYYYATAFDMNTYATYIANRYKTGSANGTISAIEIGNEDYDVSNDTYHNGGWQAEALNACYANIKAIDPNMLVICGGQLQTGVTFVPTYQAQLYTGGGVSSSGGMGSNCDATNAHYYRGNKKDPDDTSYTGTFTIANQLKTIHDADVYGDGHTGYPNRDLWLSEFGWAANSLGDSTHITFALQSQYILECIDAARLSGYCSHAFVYTMDYADANSIVKSSTLVRQAYTDYQTYIAAHPAWSSTPPLSQYAQTVLADNPTVYYRLDEQVGVKAKDSGTYGNDGTYSTTGVVYSEPGIITNDSDTCVLLDGVNGMVTCPSSINPDTWTQLTLEAWIVLSNTTFTTPAPIWANDTPGSTNTGASFYIGAGGSGLTCSIGNGTTYKTVTMGYAFIAGTQYYVAASYNGLTIQLFIDPAGTYGAIDTFSGAVSSSMSGPLTLGTNPITGNNFPGYIDEAAVYQNVALSSGRITAHFTAGISGTAPAPVFTLSPGSLTPTSPGVTKTGTTYSATVSLGETGSSIGNATWTAVSSLSGVTFSPSSGTLSPGGSPTLITIANIPGLNGTFTFSGGESETPVMVSWTVASTSAAGGFALFANGAGSANFDHFRVTGYPDPALSLLKCGRAGSSVANWNAVIANAMSSVAMNTSLDGVNWSPVSTANNPITGLATQPIVTADTFGIDSSANYLQTYQTGGAVSTWTWDTANARLAATGGTNGLLISLLPLAAGDLSMFADMDYADNSGLVFHYVSASSFYLLYIRDSGSLGGNPNSMQLSKIISGTSTTLVATTPIAFPRGTYHRIRVDMIGSAITAYFDGVQILTYTDGSPLVAGQVGLRNSSAGGASTSRYYQLYCQPFGQLITSMDSYVYTQLNLASTDPMNSPQVLDSATLVTGPNIALGVLIPGVAYQATFCSSNFDDLKKQSNYFWYLDQNKQMIFVPRNSFPAPWIIQSGSASSSNVQVAGLSVEYSGDLYRNREILTNVQATQDFVQYFTGDGQTTSWTLAYPIASGTVPTLLLNSTTPLSIGVQGMVSNTQYYYSPGATGIAQDSSQPVLNVLQTLTVSYTGSYIATIIIDNANTGDYPGTLSQEDYAAVDGTSGIIEDIFDVSQEDITKNMNVQTATQYGEQLLQAYGVVGTIITIKTLQSGLAPGQSISLFLPQYNIMNVQALITGVDIDVQQLGNGSLLYWYTVTCTEGPALSSWVKVFGSLFS